MKKIGRRAIVTSLAYFVIVSILLTGCGTSSAPSPIVLQPNPGTGNSNNGKYVNILIDSVIFNGTVSSSGDTGNLQLVTVVSDDSGHADALICPYGGVVKVQQGDNINPCQAGLTYPDNLLRDHLYVMIIAMDIKDSSTIADIGTNGISTGLSFGIEQVIRAAAPEAIAAAGAWAIVGFLALDTVIGYAGGKVKEYFQKNYLIGTQSFELSRQYDWNNGQPITAASTNNQVGFTFVVQKSSTASGQLVGNTPTISVPPVADTQAPQKSNSSATISCAEDISQVNLRSTPGYKNKDDLKDVVYKIDCGETVEVLGDSQNTDGLTWWHVSWNGYTGWIADHTGTGRTILIFNQ